MTGNHPKDAQAPFLENIAAIAAVFHTHPLHDDFHGTFTDCVGGFTGLYALCIRMAEALSDWELANGGAIAYEGQITWPEVVDGFVDELLSRALAEGIIPCARSLLPGLPILKRAEECAR